MASVTGRAQNGITPDKGVHPARCGRVICPGARRSAQGKGNDMAQREAAVPRRKSPRTSQWPNASQRRTSAALAAAGALAAGVALSLTACGSSPASSSAANSPAAAAATPPAAAALGPLTLADFPSTAGGKDARGICETWLTLRQQYEDRMTTDSPYQLNQWFSSAAWQKTQADGMALGNDPAYQHLETALGEATVGDMADAGTVRLMDAACAKGD